MAVLLPESVAQCEVLYFSFRLSLVGLIDELMGETLQVRSESCQPGCFLDRYPLLESMAPQVQLESLLTSWDRIQQHRDFTLLDEAICSASLDQLSELSSVGEQPLLKMAWSGPRASEFQLDQWVCSHARSVQVALLPACRTWQLEMLPEIETEQYLKILSLTPDERAERDEALDLVGRWRVRQETPDLGIGLLTSSERELLQAFFEEHRGLLG
jgi:hypothetical protein